MSFDRDYEKTSYKSYINDMDEYIAKLKELKKENPDEAQKKARNSLKKTGMWNDKGELIGID